MSRDAERIIRLIDHEPKTKKMFPFIFVTIRYYKPQATAAVFSRKQSFQTNLFNITQKLIVLP